MGLSPGPFIQSQSLKDHNFAPLGPIETHITSLKGLNFLESIFLTEMARRIFKVGFAFSKLTYLHRAYLLSGPCSFSVSVCQLIN